VPHASALAQKEIQVQNKKTAPKKPGITCLLFLKANKSYLKIKSYADGNMKDSKKNEQMVLTYLWI
jgi:hypothetical protein